MPLLSLTVALNFHCRSKQALLSAQTASPFRLISPEYLRTCETLLTDSFCYGYSQKKEKNKSKFGTVA
jgi:hypothetical protein